MGREAVEENVRRDGGGWRGDVGGSRAGCVMEVCGIENCLQSFRDSDVGLILAVVCSL